MPSILSRFVSAGKRLFNRPDPDERAFRTMLDAIEGLRQAHPFKPRESIEAYGDNPWLHSAINVICSEVSRTEFFLEERKGDEWVRVEEHQALETLRRPIPSKGGKSSLTQLQLFYMLVQKYLLNGEDFWLLDGRIKVSKAPTMIRPLQPANVDVVPGKDGIRNYIHRTAKGEVDLDPEDVVHFRFPSPTDMYRGHPPAKSIRYSLDTHLEADVLNLSRLKNNAVPSGVLSSENKVSPEERERLLKHWKQMYGGSGSSGKTAMLPYGFQFQNIQSTNQEMQYAEGKERNRDEILANFRVGMELLGKTESQTRANAEASIYVFDKFVILPLDEMICDTLTNDYLTQFPDTEKMRFNFPDPVPENVEEDRETAKALFANGALTPDEMRKKFGLEPLDMKGVTDTPYMGLNLVPIGSEPIADPPPLG